MINAWSLAYDVLNGTLDENFPIKKKKMSKDENYYESLSEGKDEGVVNVPDDINLDQDINIKTTSDKEVFNVSYDGLKQEHSDYWYDYTRNDPNRENPFINPEDKERAEKFIYESPDGGKTVYQRPFGEHDPTKRTKIIEEYDVPKQDSSYPVKLKDDCYPTLGSTPGVKEPSINKKQVRKDEVDEGITDLQDYISTTYGGR